MSEVVPAGAVNAVIQVTSSAGDRIAGSSVQPEIYISRSTENTAMRIGLSDLQRGASAGLNASFTVGNQTATGFNCPTGLPIAALRAVNKGEV